MPVVSVVIPLYNKAPHIATTLNSVLDQTFKDFEVVVIDDGSTDSGAEVVLGFSDPRIRLFRQKNQGVSAARNRGVNEAKTDFIAFLDADDEWMPKHLETLLRLKKEYPQAGMYTTSYKIFIESTGESIWPTYEYIQDRPWEGLLPDYFRSGAMGSPPVNSSVVGIPKKIFLEAGGFPPDYWFGEDADMFGKIALKHPVAFSWEMGARYNQDATNRACEKRLPTNHEEPFVKTARRAVRDGDVSPERIESVIEYINRKEIIRAELNIVAGNLKTARMILRECETKLYIKRKIKCWILTMIPYSLFKFLQKQKRMLCSKGLSINL